LTSALGSNIGSSSPVATSKIIKITTTGKNRDDNGNHAEVFVSNPHSLEWGCFFLDLLYFPLRLKLLGLLQLLIVGSLMFLLLQIVLILILIIIIIINLVYANFVCFLTDPAINAHSPYYIVISGLFRSAIFFHIISQSARFSGKKIILHKINISMPYTRVKFWRRNYFLNFSSPCI